MSLPWRFPQDCPPVLREFAYLKVDETLNLFLGNSETVVARCRDHSGTNHVDPNISSLEVQDPTPSQVANRCLTWTVELNAAVPLTEVVEALRTTEAPSESSGPNARGRNFL
jgi:hypothetical protein